MDWRPISLFILLVIFTATSYADPILPLKQIGEEVVEETDGGTEGDIENCTQDSTSQPAEIDLIDIISNFTHPHPHGSETPENPIFENFATKVDTFDEDCKCGRPGEPAPFPFKTRDEFSEDGQQLIPHPLIIDGQETGETEFKWMVGLARKRIYDPPGAAARVTCGATLINSRFLLTAAHCIKNEHPSKHYILFKTHNLKDVFHTNSTVMIASAKRFISHPKWNVKTVANDIGLIELETPIDFAKEPNIRPACLPSPNDGDFAGKEAIAAGWGYTQPKGAMAITLKKVTVPVISHNACTETRYGTMVTPSMLCAGYPEGGKDACTNDSGGPLTVTTPEGYHKVIGIVSWGHGCAQPSAPGVYTRVTKYLDWILSVVKGSNWCKPN